MEKSKDESVKKKLDLIEEFMVKVMVMPAEQPVVLKNKSNDKHPAEITNQKILSAPLWDDSGYSQRHYNKAIYGKSNLEPKIAAPPDKTIVIKLPTLPTNQVKSFFKSNEGVLIKLAVFLIVITGLALGSQQFIRLRNSSQGSTVTDSNIAPKEIFVPRNLPDGFRVGSGTQTLDNGAIIYSVHTDTGGLVTITQQAKPEDLEAGFFKDSTTFDTPYGKAYILQEGNKINGFLLSDKTWVLFNSDGVSSGDMRLLISSIKPS